LNKFVLHNLATTAATKTPTPATHSQPPGMSFAAH